MTDLCFDEGKIPHSIHTPFTLTHHKIKWNFPSIRWSWYRLTWSCTDEDFQLLNWWFLTIQNNITIQTEYNIILHKDNIFSVKSNRSENWSECSNDFFFLIIVAITHILANCTILWYYRSFFVCHDKQRLDSEMVGPRTSSATISP